MRPKQTLLGLITLISLIPMLATAKTLYVTDSLEVMMRRGPSTEHKIIKLLASGDPLEVLEENEGWSKVNIIEKDEERIEGWVLSRYLITRVPWRTQAMRLEDENNSLGEEIKILKEKIQNEMPKTLKLDDAYKKNLEELNALKEEYAAFRQASSDYVQLKNDFENTKMNEKQLQEALQQLEASKRNKWFALGALVLLFGIIIGLQINKQGKQNRSIFF